MARFQFQMESVLQYRRLQAEREQNVMEGLIRERDYWAWQDRQIEESRQSARRAVPQMAYDGMISLQGMDAYTERVTRQQRQVITRQQECFQRVAAQQMRVSEAWRSVKLLEKLREKALQTWRKEQDRQVEELAAESHLALRHRAQRDTTIQ